MESSGFRAYAIRSVALAVGLLAAGLPRLSGAQELTGTLFGAVKDGQGAVLPGASVRVASASLIGGPIAVSTNDRGQYRLPALPPGEYRLDIALQGFATYREEDIRIGAGATIERTAVLRVAGVEESIVVQGAGSRIDARNPGFSTRYTTSDLQSIPSRRSSMFDAIRAAPGVSPTSPASGSVTTISAFGSGTNENQFLIDGTNFTCPCNGVARSEPGLDFIQEVQVQSIGASAEFGNVQGAVINVITRQGSEQFLSDASYYAQSSGLTSQPIVRPFAKGQSGYERERYRDFTANGGGPAIHDRLWFFGGYQYLRDYDSQPGADPAFPRIYDQNKGFGKLTWNLAPAWRLVQSVHYERWINTDPPTAVTPYEAVLRRETSVPAITFGELTHTVSSKTLWDVRVGRFVFDQDTLPTSKNPAIPSHSDNVTGITTGAPSLLGSPVISRTTGKVTLSHFSDGWLGANHQWKVGTQLERGGHHAVNIVPSGARYVDSAGQPVQKISIAPYNVGALFNTAAAFASDAITISDRLTVNAGVRFDHTRAVSQDLPALDAQGHETDVTVKGLGTLYTWNILSPRFGVTAKLSADGRTILRGSYGRFSQGVMTGELEPFHPGATSTTTAEYDATTGGYTRNNTVVKPGLNILLDNNTRAPHSDEYSIGFDRELASGLAAAVAYIAKRGGNFIGWTDVGGQYTQTTRTLRDGRIVPIFELVNGASARRFLLTNQDDYSLTYNGVVVAVERRRSSGWQAYGSYTYSRQSGLQTGSGTSAAGAQISTVAPPQPSTFGRDPNDLTNATGRLANDRPHMLRAMGSFDIPRTGVAVAANFQYFSGKPWAAIAIVSVPQNAQQRVLLEPRGTRRLESQSLLDLRVSRRFAVTPLGRFDLILDVLNALNDTAGEALATENFFGSTFGQPTVFMDPRRAMVGVRVNLGQ